MGVNRKIQPSVVKIRKINKLKPVLFYLDNNIPCYQLNIGNQDLLKIEFLFPAGLYYQSKNLQAKLSNKIISLGTESFSAFEIAQTIDKYGAYLYTDVDKDHAVITIYSLNKYLHCLLPVLKEIIYHPVFPEKEFSNLLDRKRQEFFIKLEKVKYLARINFEKYIFGDHHPYGFKTEKDDFVKIQLTDLKKFHQEYYKTNQCKIIVSGKIPQNFNALLNKHFGMYNNKKGLYAERVYNENGISGKFKILKKGSLQSAIRIGRSLFNRLHPDYTKFSILNTVLGGYFGSRLMSNIRENKGYTYGVYSVIDSLKHGGCFFISTEVGEKYTTLTVDEIYREMQNLKEKKIPGKELKLVKNYMIGYMVRNLDGPFLMAEQLKKLIKNDLPTTYFQDFLNELNNVKGDDLIEIANKYFDFDSLTEIIVGN